VGISFSYWGRFYQVTEPDRGDILPVRIEIESGALPFFNKLLRKLAEFMKTDREGKSLGPVQTGQAEGPLAAGPAFS
jgi:hypothetical protein